MHFLQTTRRGIGYSVFVGVLVGSVFAGSGAFADGPIPISAEISDLANPDSPVYGFDQIRENLNGNYVLAFDDAELILSPAGDYSYIPGTFTGNFDGNNKTLAGLTRPLFESISGVVQNLNLAADTHVADGAERAVGILGSGALANSLDPGGSATNISVTGNVTGIQGVNYFYSDQTTSYSGSVDVGGLVGVNQGTISNSHFDGSVLGTDAWAGSIGGLVGNSEGEVSSSTSSGTVNGDNRLWDTNSVRNQFLQLDSESNLVLAPAAIVTGSNYSGGIVGYSTGNISNSSSSATVTGFNYVGGLVGYTTHSIINSSASGTITNISNPDETEVCECADFIRTGGLAGETTSTISNSSASGDVTGNANKLGGLVGFSGGTIEESSASGNVVGTGTGWDVGGLVGYTTHPISNSFATGSVSGWRFVGGLVGITGSNITNSYVNSVGNIEGRDSWVGGLAGQSEGVIQNSYVQVLGTISGQSNVGGLAGYVNNSLIISSQVLSANILGEDNVGGLVGVGFGQIRNSTSNAQVSGANNIGGLIGNSHMSIDYSNSSGTVTATGGAAGGLAGYVEDFAISRSFSNSLVTGNTNIGGLVGMTIGGDISSSYATGEVRIIEGADGSRVGGLVGWSNRNLISNSYSIGNVIGFANNVADNFGGLVGVLLDGTLKNSYSRGNVFANTNLGGLVGSLEGSDVINSFAFGEVFRLAGDSPFFGNFIGKADYASGDKAPRHNSELIPINLPYDFSGVANSKLATLNSSLEAADWGACSEINEGSPYLLELASSGRYEGSCPILERPIRERAEREVREVAEARAPEKIEKSVGFKNETPLPKSALISFVESTEKIDLAKVKAVEIAPTANVKVVAKAGEALQISLKSESKEPVELWVKSPDGSWLLAGVITFDKDGKAILPPLKFKNIGNYSLVLSKPSADSARGSAPLNQTGSLLVAVS